MSGPCMNIYGRCRRDAGLTQEQAAELLDCSVRTLANWEGGVNRPPDEKAQLMCVVYRSPLLAFEHLRGGSELARELLPELRSLSLAQAALTLLSAIRSFNVEERDWELMEIAADGSVDADERHGFELLMLRLDRIVEASYELRLCREAIKKPADAEAPTGHI